MTRPKSTRIESIDLLRGLVMVIMALDHVRDYFHIGAMVSDPADLETTTPLLFFTRFITHYCAPVFIFLAGTSAFLFGRNKTVNQLRRFLFSRGLWLVFIEVTLMSLLWWFDLSFGFFNLQVIWAIGLCMIALSILIHLPFRAILITGLILVFGHNLLDSITVSGTSPTAVAWYVLHQPAFVQFGERWVSFLYPILPWIGVMALGYCFGQLYHNNFNARIRKRWLLILGFGCIGLFLLLRGVNIYGDPVAWSIQKNSTFTFLSFINVMKYPPSLLFLLITMGPAFLFLFATEKIKNFISDFFIVFGRVPFFYYVIHVFVIHVAAMIGLEITGGSWREMILTNDVFIQGKLAEYGYSLGVVYLVWIGIVMLLYPVCLWYMKYKLRNRDKWWLSYL